MMRRADSVNAERLTGNSAGALFTLKFVAFASPPLSANRPFGHLKGILKPNKIFRCQSNRQPWREHLAQLADRFCQRRSL
jgi:hypothetical protein